MLPANAIFISYRRSDSEDVTGRMCDRLKLHFGVDAIFTDVGSIPLGANFPDYLQQTVDSCKVLLAVIGPTWLEVFQSRLARPSSDWVRSEIARALSQKIFVIPVLAGSAKMPAEDTLTADLKAMRQLNAAQVRSGSDFDHDMILLTQRLTEIVGIKIPVQLTSKQMNDLQAALLSALPDEDSLAMLTQFYLEKPLNQITGAKTYNKIVFDVIQWAHSYNKVPQLVNGAIETNPDSLELSQFINSLS